MKTRKKALTYFLCLLTTGTVLFAAPARSENAAPKLVLQITVDQLRGDLPGRYMKGMGEGGFRYLMKQGVWYANANYTHANTETIVGHTILATGAQPSVNGMIGNVWFDRETGKLIYNVEDANYRSLTAGAGVDKATELDPTQKIASSDGRSPASILVSTFGDELASYTAGKSKVFGVSIKDRGAVSMAGHAGKAFWFSKKSGEFITSSYYYDHYPSWVDVWNKKKLPQAYSGKSWELLHDKSTYQFGATDDQSWEMDLPGYGRVFPHPYGQFDGKLFTTLLTFSPVGDELTLDFAKSLIDAEQLGQDDVPDYLSVSFSSTDYVGHAVGPSSLEAEDNMLRLDRTLAELFAYVDKRVGLKNTLIVLSADHGAPEAPGYLNSLGIEAKYVTPDKWDKAPAIETLKRKLGIDKEIIKTYFHPYLYLNQDVIREKGLDQAKVENAVAEELMKFEDVTLAISSSALREGNLPNTPLIQSVLRNYHLKRSGDIYLVFKSNHFISDFDGTSVSVTHGSPWRYDSFVPVVFAGGKLRGQRIYRAIEPAEIAPTLAAVLGVKAPSGARGSPLEEVIHGFEK
ncbi:MAG: alkaline phosphatase family protein [Nitrosomonadales bacterium]|nr:MAG: alkaline phosphatase family protein [Nitrosomonadales bacterium]